VSAVETAPVSWSLRITLGVLLVLIAAEVWVLWMVAEVASTVADGLRWLAALLRMVNGQ
jgi:cytochrome bd-type quinol oxidase subunit 1